MTRRFHHSHTKLRNIFSPNKNQHPNPYRKPNCVDLYPKPFPQEQCGLSGICRAPSRISDQILFLPFTKAITQLHNLDLFLESNFSTSPAGTTRDCKLIRGSNADRFNPGVAPLVIRAPCFFFVLFTGALWGKRWTEDEENVLLKEKTNTNKRNK